MSVTKEEKLHFIKNAHEILKDMNGATELQIPIMQVLLLELKWKCEELLNQFITEPNKAEEFEANIKSFYNKYQSEALIRLGFNPHETHHIGFMSHCLMGHMESKFNEYLSNDDIIENVTIRKYGTPESECESSNISSKFPPSDGYVFNVMNHKNIVPILIDVAFKKPRFRTFEENEQKRTEYEVNKYMDALDTKGVTKKAGNSDEQK